MQHDNPISFGNSPPPLTGLAQHSDGGGARRAEGATLTDHKLPHTTNNQSIDYYLTDITSAQDYYPGGMLMPGRSYSSDSYRFGFNGKENDNDVKGTGNQQDYGMRIYDPRIAKFLSVDPLAAEYPWYTPYQFAGNSPILNIDLDGLEPININGQGTNTSYHENGGVTLFSYNYSGTVYGPYIDQNAATQAAFSGGATIYNLWFSVTSTTATNTGFNGSTTNVNSTYTSGYFPSYTMGNSLVSTALENGDSYYNSITSFNSFWNGRSTGSGACYPTDVGGTLTDLCIRQPIQYGLEQVGMGENAAYWTSSGLTFAGMFALGNVKGNITKKVDYLFENKGEAMNWARQQLGHNTSKMFNANGKWIGWSNSNGKVYWGHGDWGKGVGSSTFPHLNYNIGGVKGHLFLHDKILNRGMMNDFNNYFRR